MNVFLAMFFSFSLAFSVFQDRLTNQDIINLVKSGIAPEIIIAKVKTTGGNFDTSPSALKELKEAGVPDSVMLIMIEVPSAKKKESIGEPPIRKIDELTSSFKRLQTSIFTVWSEFGHGTGFIVDQAGLIMTNQHVVGPSEQISIQFDEKRKIPAVLLAADAEKDVAVLWADIKVISEATVAPIAEPKSSEPTIIEGERVFTIGSPLSQRKILTTGIAGKIEARAIISDININPGNSGGPLFNSLGQVVGITTFGEDRGSGPGISGIVRIEEALPLLSQARSKIKSLSLPSATFLPVEPPGEYPIEAIKASLQFREIDTRPYTFSAGDFEVAVITPILKYHLRAEGQIEAVKEKSRRNKKEVSIKNSYRPLEELRSWAEYAGEYKPIIMIQAMPKLSETFWSAFNRGLAANYGILAQAKLRYKTDFYRMRLFCDGNEIQPIQPGKEARVHAENNRFLNLTDATYVGIYSYPAEAISPACQTVMLEIYSEKNPDKATKKIMDKKTIGQVWADFEPYRRRTIGDESTKSAVSPASMQNKPSPASPKRTCYSEGRKVPCHN